ncbi:MAG: hypothetical protein K6C13_14925, partial [Oscillospiraceae bacterium]|nr:hypothetical protein [Oscillospiraceae bacterium]
MTRKTKASRFAGVFLSVCMTVSLMAQMCIPAAAADVPDPVGASFVKAGITYYNVYSTNFDSDKRFYEDLIDKKSVLLDIDGSSGAKKYSIADMWFLTQLGIFDKMGFKYGP